MERDVPKDHVREILCIEEKIKRSRPRGPQKLTKMWILGLSGWQTTSPGLEGFVIKTKFTSNLS